MIAPSEGEVGEAVHEDDGAAVGGVGGTWAENVAVGAAVEVGGAELNARVVEGLDFVEVGRHAGGGVSEERV